MHFKMMVEMPMEGKDSVTEEDIAVEVPYIPAVDDSIPDCVGLTWANWCKKKITLVKDGGEGVALESVEFVRGSQTVDGRTTHGDDNIGVVVCKVFQANSSVTCHSLWSWPIKKTLF
jgi:hypothetical protein